MVQETSDHQELRSSLRIVRHRKWTIVVFTLLVVAASAGASSLQTPIYQASADLLLQPRTTESIFDPTVAHAVSMLAAGPTEIRVVQSEPVRRIVEERIGAAPAVSVTNPAQSDFLVVTAESPDPERAALVANTYAQAYVDFRRQQAVDDIEAAIAPLEARIKALDAQLAALAAVPAPGAAPGPVPFGSADAVREALERNRDLSVGRIDQLKLAAAQKTGGAQLFSGATAPTTPIRPTPVRTALVALVIGLVLGVGLAFLREYLDDSLKSREQVERTVPGVPVLGVIPVLTSWKDKKSAVVVSVSDPQSTAAEAYRSLRTSVQFLGIERSLRTLQVTSPSATEGKSTTVANLAVAVARAGRRVVVVDADLRRSRLHHFFGLRHDVGFTSVLLGASPLVDALQKVPGVADLYLLASGPAPPNPSELLAGARCAEVLRDLGEHCDLVLIDCPPVLPVTDASVLASRVDGTLLVVSAATTERRQLRRAVQVLGHVNSPLLGVVFNGGADDSSYAYSYGYRYTAAPGPPSKADGREADDRELVPAASSNGAAGARPALVPEAVGTRRSAGSDAGSAPGVRSAPGPVVGAPAVSEAVGTRWSAGSDAGPTSGGGSAPGPVVGAPAVSERSPWSPRAPVEPRRRRSLLHPFRR